MDNVIPNETADQVINMKEQGTDVKNKDLVEDEVAVNNQTESIPAQKDNVVNIADNANHCVTRKRYVFDSDSDNEGTNTQEGECNIQTGKAKHYSDSEDEASGTKKGANKARNSGIIDSDSECEDKVPNAQEDASVYINNSKKVALENNTYQQKSRLEALCDSESDEELIGESGEHHNKENISNKPQVDQNLETLKSKKNDTSKGTKNKREKVQKMTPKEAAEMRKEIQSESQRMIREKNVSLPYHKPKPHNIKEFLAKRPKLASAVPTVCSAPPSVAIKMSTEQLEIISKKFKEREKELLEFYKSGSESDSNDSDEDYIPPTIENEFEENRTEETKLQLAEDVSKVGPTLSEITRNGEDTDSNIENKKTNTEKSNISLEINDKKDPNMSSDVIENIDTAELKLPETQEAKNSLQLIDNSITDNDSGITSGNCEPVNSMTYEFNLDDLDEHSENFSKNGNSSIDQNTEASCENENLKKDKGRFESSDLDREIENFGEDQEKTNDLNLPVPPKSKLELLKEKLGSIKPKLSGGPDDLIDLEVGANKPNEVVQLMERFVKHASTKKENHKHKVHLSIVTVESGGDVHKETVAMSVDDEDSPAIEEKPGAKLQKLRQELQTQMAQRKSEIWQQKASLGILNTTDSVNEDQKEGYEQDLPFDDDDEEEEMTDTEESEEEVEDEWVKDKPVKKSVFLDQEAQESDIEDDDEQDLNDNDENVDEGDDRSEINSELHDEKSNLEYEKPATDKKCLKRIIKAFEDSDDEDDSHTFAIADKEMPNTGESIDDDYVIPPHQPQPHKTPVRQPISQQKSNFDFLTPISFMTDLQNLNSVSKSVKDSPIISPFRMHQDSPTKDQLCPASQKKLFADEDTTSSQSSTQIEPNPDNCKMMSDSIENNDVCTQDLLNICSGEFTGVTQLEPSADSNHREDIELNKDSEVKILGEDQDLLISQLLNEEEIENFTRKFDSPVKKSSDISNGEEKIDTEIFRTSDENTQESVKEITGGGVIDSDDEDEVEIKKRGKKRKIVLSDDESSDETPEDDEEIDLADVDELDDDHIAPENIDYDSEENEIDLTEEQSKNVKMTDFLEAEAELSESEWGSEDEDEKDLDKLEFEAGDMEKFDEDRVKEDLEKIHMRRLLDDDTREVKILQELLLEDGELHGTGRQRQFRWKNVLEDTNDDEENKAEDEIYMEEEESEEQWRKKRHEREMFLKEQKQKSSASEVLECDLLKNSQLLKIGQKVLQKSQSQNNSQNNTPNEKPSGNPSSPVLKQFSLFHKRGSFLSRGEQVLQKVAEYSKVTAVLGVNASKTTKNFIFQKVSTTEETVQKKRKASDGTPNVIKRLRLSNLSPAVKNKSDKAKKLFNDL